VVEGPRCRSSHVHGRERRKGLEGTGSWRFAVLAAWVIPCRGQASAPHLWAAVGILTVPAARLPAGRQAGADQRCQSAQKGLRGMD